MAELDELDHRLLAQLASYGPRGIWPRVPELAAKLGVHVRTVQRHLRRLEAAGMVRREPVFERPDDPNWAARGRRIQHLGEQVSNTYALTYPGDTPNPGDRPAEQPKHAESLSPLYHGKPSTPPVQGQGSADDEQQEPVTGVRLWPVDDAGQLEPVTLHVPAAGQLDHDPGVNEVLSALQAGGLGDTRLVEMRRNEGEPGPTYPIRGGRQVELETCSAEDFHRALDQLDRDTCSNGDRCQGRHRCKRHSPRRRAR